MKKLFFISGLTILVLSFSGCTGNVIEGPTPVFPKSYTMKGDCR